MDLWMLLPATVISVVLLASGAAKLASPSAAASSLNALRVPLRRPRLLYGIAACGEIFLGMALILFSGPLLAVASGVAVAVTATFVVIVERARRLGSQEDCGCFGDLVATSIGGWLVARNVTLLFLSLLATVPSFAGTARVSVMMQLVADEPSRAAVAVIIVIVIMTWVTGRAHGSGRSAGPHMRPAAQNATNGRTLLMSDGEVVDPVQRALRGRRQLLVFVRPGCAPCELAVKTVESLQPTATDLDVRIVVPAGDGNSLIAVNRAYADSSADIAVDFGAGLAQTFSVPTARPAAILIGPKGDLDGATVSGSADVRNLLFRTAHPASGDTPLPL